MLKAMLAFALFCSSSAYATVVAHSREEIAKHFRAAGFSGAVGVYSSTTTFEEAFGHERGRPLSVTDHFLIGSITKQFTAAAILKLREQGKLELHDHVLKHIPSFRYQDVTIHHLLAQTSGVAEITETPRFELLKKQRFVTLDPLIALIVGLRRDFPAGQRWAYSNSNYLLLSRVVEAASGESWWSFVKRELVDPAGMKGTFFASERSPALVSGHDFDRDYALIAINDIAYRERGWANGAGGLESTVRDLSAWNSALYGGRILNSRSLELMTTAHGKASDKIAYGYGLFLATDEVSHEIYYFHPGGIPGFITYNSYYPKRKMSTIALANYNSIESVDFAHALERFETSAKAELHAYTDDASVPPFSIDAYAGRFAGDDRSTAMDLAFESGKLYASSRSQGQHRLVIRGPGRFYDRALGAELKFPDHSTDEFTLSGESGVSRFRRWER